MHLADEGADIIALDICADIESNEYPLATRDWWSFVNRFQTKMARLSN